MGDVVKCSVRATAAARPAAFAVRSAVAGRFVRGVMKEVS
jgi:hypothetical protein